MTECEHRATLLVADDEPEIVEMLEEYFAGRGFRVLTAGSGQEALEQAVHGPDLVLLDVGMPRLDGFEVCRRLREHLTCPILFLTARVEDVDALEGFACGADDYVLKPFSLAVLGARVDAHLARDQCQQVRAEVRFDGDLAVDYRTRTVTVAGAPVELTRREFDIVAFLSKTPGRCSIATASTSAWAGGRTRAIRRWSRSTYAAYARSWLRPAPSTTPWKPYGAWATDGAYEKLAHGAHRAPARTVA